MPVSCCRKRISRAMAMGRYMEGSRASAHDMRLLWRHAAASEGAGPPRRRAPPIPPPGSDPGRDGPGGPAPQTTGSWVSGLRAGCCDTRRWGYWYPIPQGKEPRPGEAGCSHTRRWPRTHTHLSLDIVLDLLELPADVGLGPAQPGQCPQRLRVPALREQEAWRAGHEAQQQDHGDHWPLPGHSQPAPWQQEACGRDGVRSWDPGWTQSPLPRDL